MITLNEIIKKSRFFASRKVEHAVEKRWLKYQRYGITHKAQSVFLSHPKPKNLEIESFFETSDSRRIPVFKSYRYSEKQGWLYFDEPRILSELKQKGILGKEHESYLKKIAGTRTLGASMESIRAHFIETVAPLKHLFLEGSLEEKNAPSLIPDPKETASRINAQVETFTRLFGRLSKFGINIPPHAKILEIGFISGGHSLFALEKMGYQVHGIDNGYTGFAKSNSLVGHIQKSIESTVQLHSGDITAPTEFPDASFDIIYSASVLEHIKDIPAALKEMRRLLKPSGVLIHSYNPYFCPGGGHALGILDSPWGHVRLNEVDYLRYIKEFRPHECKTASHWIREALTRNYPLRLMQKEIIHANFKLLYWEESPASPRALSGLTNEIIQESFAINPEIALEDLITQNVFVVAGYSTAHSE